MSNYLSVAAVAFVVCGTVLAADRSPSSDSVAFAFGVPVSAVHDTIDRDDYDAGQYTIYSEYCRLGMAGAEGAAEVCWNAYDTAYRTQNFRVALQSAAIGCERDKNANQCRRVADLPLRMGIQNIPVPDSFAAEVRRIADFVCLSGNRLKNVIGADITGRTCQHFAVQFGIAKDAEWGGLLTPGAQRYADTIYEPGLAAKLHQAACEKWSYPGDCVYTRSLSAR